MKEERIDTPAIRKRVKTPSGYAADLKMEIVGFDDEGHVNLDVSVWDTEKAMPKVAERILAAKPDMECVKDMVETRANEFHKKFDGLEENLKDLANSYADYIMYARILRAMSIEMPATTENQWVPDDVLHRRTGERISNNVFKAWIYSVHEEKSWKNPEMVWRVSYAVSLNSPVDTGFYANIIPQVDNKSICWVSVKEKKHTETFTDKDAADKYIADRKAWMEKTFFVEQNPVVPRDFERFFLSNGIRIPGYRYEEKEGEKIQ